MARRKSVMSALVQAGHAAERQRATQIRAQTRAAKEAERAQRAYERAQIQAQKASEREQAQLYKEQVRLYTEARIAEVALQNEQLEQEIQQLTSLLDDALAIDSFIDLSTLKQEPEIPPPPSFGADRLPGTTPFLPMYLPAELTGIRRLIPGAKERYEQEVAAAQARYAADMEVYNQQEVERQTRLAARKASYEQQIEEIREQAAAQNAEIDQFQQDFAAGLPSAVANYFVLIIEASSYPEGFPQQAQLAFVPESKQLVVEYDLPPYETVPQVGSYKYIKTQDEVVETARPVTQRKALYASVIAQVTLRTLHELFNADRTGQLESIVFNGYVDSIDKGTGRPVRPCLVTVRTSRDVFTQIDLSRVEPTACLKVLNAAVSKSPTELLAVRPVLEFNMIDPRFIQETDVLSGLDHRQNLLELTPSEFEALISNLFGAMGLETRLTQASRDGGVDCVAYDPRPILGGKVVIQAKRYEHTVGVSAVRDLYGTVMNEGASKGILVTTSGYGKAAFEFANGKPLQLISGSELLYLLAEHAHVEAKIEPVENQEASQPTADKH